MKNLFKKWFYANDKERVKLIKKHGSEVVVLDSGLDRKGCAKFGASRTCRHCDKTIKEEDFDCVVGYWTPIWLGCHKECIEDEAYECQKIDADCNDCAFFKRGKMYRKGDFKGTCLKFNKPTTAHVKYCSNHKCFKHRKDK